jgi:lipopolysaccharide/colanic/teichoic acid biosynthesis glycosyltransferase
MKIKFPTHNRIEYEAQQQINQLATERLTQIDQTTWMKFKFLLQQIFVAISLVVFAIPMLAIYLLVRLTSAGPAIFKQVRVGLNGKIFTMYKFRTMSVKAELNSGPVWSPGKNDPRLTTVGRFLRFVHLDELPQLFNVLKGDMSLIGPRPERPVFVIMLSAILIDCRFGRASPGWHKFIWMLMFRSNASARKSYLTISIYIAKALYSICKSHCARS